MNLNSLNRTKHTLKPKNSSLMQAIGDYDSFCRQLLVMLSQTKIPFKEFQIDHLCYRVSSYRNYSLKKQELAKLAHLLTETEVNGRPIACYELFEPIEIDFADRIFHIPVIELPAPKAGKQVRDGLEHFEMCTDFHPKSIATTYPEIHWTTSGMKKNFNPEIEIEFENLGTVKFHELPLKKVVETEIRHSILNFVYEDDYFLAVDKPANFFVQPPSQSDYFIDPQRVCLYHLQTHFAQKIYPVHRLDSPTSGLVLFAKSQDTAAKLSALFKQRKISKTYRAVVRGFTSESGSIDHALQNPKTKILTEALTNYKTLSHLEVNTAVLKYPTSRYSLVEIFPKTGRWHQIRRHFDMISHPLIGDILHGDSYHNRYFRDELGLSGLWLRATELQFIHPLNGEKIHIKAPPDPRWNKIDKLFSTAKK